MDIHWTLTVAALRRALEDPLLKNDTPIVISLPVKRPEGTCGVLLHPDTGEPLSILTGLQCTFVTHDEETHLYLGATGLPLERFKGYHACTTALKREN